MSHADSVRASTYSVLVPTNKVLIEDTFQLTWSHPKEKTRKVWSRVGIEPSGPSGEREISNEPSQGPGPLGS